MKNENLHLITGFILGLMILTSFMLGGYIQEHGNDKTNFFRSHYKNKTFLNTMSGDEPSIPIQCNSFHQTQGFTKNNIPYQNCLKYNSSQEQIKFMNDCFWMGPDYLILVGTLVFKYFFPVGLIGMFLAIIFSKKEKEL